MSQLEQRARRDTDRVVSTSVAAAMLEKSRQAVDHGLRDGAVAGFRDPVARRLWVDRDWVLERLPASRALLSRLANVEKAVGLASVSNGANDGARAAGVDEPPVSVQAQNVTLRETSLQLLAAFEAYDEFATRTEEAERLEDAAREQRRLASAALRRVNSELREALSQTLVPGSLTDLPSGK